MHGTNDSLMVAMCLETARCLEDGIVETAIEADMGLVLGDVNFDGRFNSTDLITIFQIGEFEDGIPDSVTSETGNRLLHGASECHQSQPGIYENGKGNQ